MLYNSGGCQSGDQFNTRFYFERSFAFCLPLAISVAYFTDMVSVSRAKQEFIDVADSCWQDKSQEGSSERLIVITDAYLKKIQAVPVIAKLHSNDIFEPKVLNLVVMVSTASLSTTCQSQDHPSNDA